MQNVVLSLEGHENAHLLKVVFANTWNAKEEEEEILNKKFRFDLFNGDFMECIR